jgi:hypothetical protein
LKKMIAAGSGNPMHYLAEPETNNRATAESAGGPTFRHYQQRQAFVTWLLADVARVVVARRARVDPGVDAGAAITVTADDISARDNGELATAAAAIAGTLLPLRDRQVIDDAELLRLVYKFAGEVADVPELLRRGRAAGALHSPLPDAGRPGHRDHRKRAHRVPGGVRSESNGHPAEPAKE